MMRARGPLPPARNVTGCTLRAARRTRESTWRSTTHTHSLSLSLRPWLSRALLPRIRILHLPRKDGGVRAGRKNGALFFWFSDTPCGHCCCVGCFGWCFSGLLLGGGRFGWGGKRAWVSGGCGVWVSLVVWSGEVDGWMGLIGEECGGGWWLWFRPVFALPPKMSPARAYFGHEK